jgi:hypothetical protein
MIVNNSDNVLTELSGEVKIESSNVENMAQPNILSGTFTDSNVKVVKHEKWTKDEVYFL